MVRDVDDRPIQRDEYAEHLQAQLDLAGGAGASGAAVDAGGITLPAEHAEVAAALLDELAGVYRDRGVVH